MYFFYQYGFNLNFVCRSKDIHESSYLPFIFSSPSNVVTDESVSEAFPRKIAGRRTFNNKGEEVFQSVKSLTPSRFALNLGVINYGE